MFIASVYDKKHHRSQSFAASIQIEVIRQAQAFLEQQGISPDNTDYPVTMAEIQTDVELQLKKALEVAEELGSTILTEYVYGVDRGDFDDPTSGANDPDEWAKTKKNVIAKLGSIGIDGEAIYRDIYEEVIMGGDDDDSD